MAFFRGPNIVTDGLVLHVDAASSRSYPGSGTTWTDLSPTKNNGTLINGTGFNTSNFGSLVFDGTNDYVNFPHTSAYNMSSLTVLVWIKLDSPYTSTFRNIISKSGTDRDWNLYTYSSSNNGNINYFHLSTARASGYPSTAFISGNLSLNTWHQVGFSMSSSSFFYVLNGKKLQIDTSVSFSNANNSYPIRIGSDGSNYTNGNIANTTVYNKQLSANEILQNYNAIKKRFL